jgi:alpha-glucosidase
MIMWRVPYDTLKINNYNHMNKLNHLSRIVFVTLISVFLLAGCINWNEIIIKSPSEKIVVKIENNDSFFYSIKDNGEDIIKNAPLGLEFKKSGLFYKNLEINSVKRKTVDNEWKPVYGEKSSYRNFYNEMILSLEETVAPHRSIEIIFRVYNEGVAFRYKVNTSEEITIVKELTGFRFAGESSAWVTNNPQGIYKKMSVGKIDKPCEGPLVIETGNKIVAIGEAELVAHSKIKFRSAAVDSLTIVCTMAGDAVYNSTFLTPWRYVMVGKTPGELLENNSFVLNLNEPNKIENSEWIKPGKVIREVTLTTRGAKACIDFAARHNLQYVEFDAGWYGNEYDNSSDATTVTVDPKRSPGPLDLPEIIKYGDKKNIGILLYVNGRAMINQLDELLPLYRSWGIKGVKYGFVNTGPQYWTNWLHEAIRKAADNQLMVDIHDNYRPTGHSRTYPNLMTQEGIRGDEESPSTEHSLITIFTRMVAGAADNTNCYFAERVQNKMGGKTAQMAKTVMIYSPWQFIYWYDRPAGASLKKGGAGASKGVIVEGDDIKFYDALPTVWDDTKVLEGKIGEYATIARKSGDDWFVGSLAANSQRVVKIPFGFLDKKKSYEATIYFQDKDDLKNNRVSIEKTDVNSETLFSKKLEANSGLAIIVRKK